MGFLFKIVVYFFEREILQFAFNRQQKDKDLSDLHQVFIDSNGKKYYQYTDDLDIPIIRKGHIERLLNELQSCIAGDELKTFLETMSLAINRKENGNLKPDIAKIGFLIEQMEQRRTLLIHPDILFAIAAAMYIREDENPAVWDEEIQEQKVNQFKKDSATGLHDFFYQGGLKKYIPFLNISQEELTHYIKEAQIKVKAERKIVNEMLKNYRSNSKAQKSSVHRAV